MLVSQEDRFSVSYFSLVPCKLSLLSPKKNDKQRGSQSNLDGFE